nr:MAG TPA: hypothetical protein [Caudoviricetes sp.]
MLFIAPLLNQEWCFFIPLARTAPFVAKYQNKKNTKKIQRKNKRR